jgi:Transposase DDE domain group 1
MTHDYSRSSVHLAGEQPPVEDQGLLRGVGLDSFAGPVHVEWDTEAALTPLGQLPFFIDFLKATGLFDAFVADCPLRYRSPNAPKKRDVLGTAMVSILSGHKRYAHIAALRSDSVLPELLGMKKIVSEDAVRRAFAAIGEDEGTVWLRQHLDHCTAPLLAEPWILDIDTTVKPLYGHQEGAVVGYNPKKPGRPSHSYHTYSMAGARLILDVDVAAGNEHTSKHFAPGLWALLDRIPRDSWPVLLRADAGFGNEAIMREAEQRGLPYLFKLRLTANVKRMIERLSTQREWTNAGQGWQAKESLLRLEGWSRQRRVIILRRRVKGDLAVSSDEVSGQQRLSFVDVDTGADVYEYSVLVTSLNEELASFGQLYRDRGDSENIFDELKNQWGWGGYVTQDLARCQLAARMVGLFYNWWTIFVRLVEPNRHMEAITSRPLLLHAIATRVRHARQTTITVASSHAKAIPAAKAFRAVAVFLRELAKNAERLTSLQRWQRILARAFQIFLQGRQFRSPPRLASG